MNEWIRPELRTVEFAAMMELCPIIIGNCVCHCYGGTGTGTGTGPE